MPWSQSSPVASSRRRILPSPSFSEAAAAVPRWFSLPSLPLSLSLPFLALSVSLISDTPLGIRNAACTASPLPPLGPTRERSNEEDGGCVGSRKQRSSHGRESGETDM